MSKLTVIIAIALINSLQVTFGDGINRDSESSIIHLAQSVDESSGTVSGVETSTGTASGVDTSTGTAKTPICITVCVKWGKQCSVDTRGAVQCHQVCEEYGEKCT